MDLECEYSIKDHDHTLKTSTHYRNLVEDSPTKSCKVVSYTCEKNGKSKIGDGHAECTEKSAAGKLEELCPVSASLAQTMTRSRFMSMASAYLHLRSPVDSKDASAGVPEQGYSGETVSHENMKTAVSNFTNEYGPGTVKETKSGACAALLSLAFLFLY